MYPLSNLWDWFNIIFCLIHEEERFGRALSFIHITVPGRHLAIFITIPWPTLFYYWNKREEKHSTHKQTSTHEDKCKAQWIKWVWTMQKSSHRLIWIKTFCICLLPTALVRSGHKTALMFIFSQSCLVPYHSFSRLTRLVVVCISQMSSLIQSQFE